MLIGSLGGLVQLFSGADFSLLLEIVDPEWTHYFGHSVAAAGDVDGDGSADFIVGASGEDLGGTDSGSVFVYSGATGVLLHRFDGDAASDSLGGSVAGGGDLDGDGVPDVAAGATQMSSGDPSPGYVRAWSGAAGAVSLPSGREPLEGFGACVSDAGTSTGTAKTIWLQEGGSWCAARQGRDCPARMVTDPPGRGRRLIASASQAPWLVMSDADAILTSRQFH